MEDLVPATKQIVGLRNPARQLPSRKAQLNARRAQQRARTPGFFPIMSKNIDAAITAASIVIATEDVAMGRTRTAAELEESARSRVASQLPKAAPTKLYRPRPSKNDDPTYRGQGGVGPRRQERYDFLSEVLA